MRPLSLNNNIFGMGETAGKKDKEKKRLKQRQEKAEKILSFKKLLKV